jgi:NADH-quinone oxidoreductase subunit M
MIQRTFYADLGSISGQLPAWDITSREHIALWPLVILFLYMGVASPSFTRVLDPIAVHYAGFTSTLEPGTIKHAEAETYATTVTTPATSLTAAQPAGGDR